jgi:predicted amidohydrolase
MIAAALLAAFLQAGPTVVSETTPIRVAGAQIPVVRDIRKNVEAISRAIEVATKEKADVLITPEGSLSGYVHDFDAAAVGAALKEILQKAREARLALVLGTCYEEDGARYNGQLFVDKNGTFLGSHTKILRTRRLSTPDAKGEVDWFKANPLRTFDLAGITVGGLLCNDLWANPEWTPMEDPHLTQKLAGMGARVIFHSVNAGSGEGKELELVRSYHESNLRLRARAGRLWIVTVNAADPESKRSGHSFSGIVDPKGNWIVQADPKGEQFFLGTIELPKKP